MFHDLRENNFPQSQNSQNLSSFLHLSKGNMEQENSEDSFDDSLCPFCPKLLKFKEAQIMLNNALYQKYSSSQNYYYKKEIEKFYSDKLDLIGPVRKKICDFNDDIGMTENNEYLLEFFERDEVQSKIDTLVEYYKYHNEVPRLFFKSLMRLIYKFYNKKRKLQFKKLQKLLQENENQSLSGFIGMSARNKTVHEQYSSVLKSKYFQEKQESSINLQCLDLELSKIKMKEICNSKDRKQSYSSFFNESLFGFLNNESQLVQSQMIQLTSKINEEIQKSLKKSKPQQALVSGKENLNTEQNISNNLNFQRNIENINLELHEIFPKNGAFINLFWQVLNKQMKIYTNPNNKDKDQKFKKQSQQQQSGNNYPKNQSLLQPQRYQNQNQQIHKLVQEQKQQMQQRSRTTSPRMHHNKGKSLNLNSLSNFGKQGVEIKSKAGSTKMSQKKTNLFNIATNQNLIQNLKIFNYNSSSNLSNSNKLGKKIWNKITEANSSSKIVKTQESQNISQRGKRSESQLNKLNPKINLKKKNVSKRVRRSQTNESNQQSEHSPILMPFSLRDKKQQAHSQMFTQRSINNVEQYPNFVKSQSTLQANHTGQMKSNKTKRMISSKISKFFKMPFNPTPLSFEMNFSQMPTTKNQVSNKNIVSGVEKSLTNKSNFLFINTLICRKNYFEKDLVIQNSLELITEQYKITKINFCKKFKILKNQGQIIVKKK